MGSRGEARARAPDEPPALFVDELSPVGQSLVWAFARGVAWSPRLHAAIANRRPLESFLRESAAWRSERSEKATSHERRLQQPASPPALVAPPPNTINGEELYQILSHKIYEREGVEHQDKRIKTDPSKPIEPVKPFIDRFPIVVFDRRGINANGLRVTGPDSDGVVLNAFGLEQSIPITLKDCVFEGRIILDNARLGPLSLSGARFPKSAKTEEVSPDLSADAARIDGDFALSGVTARAIDIRGATIEGSLSLSGATLGGGGVERALNCDAITVGASVFLVTRDPAAPFSATGEVSFIRAIIGGQFACVGGRFANPGKIALECDAITVGADVFLRTDDHAAPFSATGEVNFRGATIGGQLSCSGGRFASPGKIALQCDAITVGASVFLSADDPAAPFTAVGEVNFVRATIEGTFSCTGGRFANPGETALQCDAITVGADVFLRGNAAVVGEINLTRANIAGNVHIRSCLLGRCPQFSPGQIDRNGGQGGSRPPANTDVTGSWQINLRSAQIGAALFLADNNCAAHCRGSIDLRDARVRIFADDESYWRDRPVTLRLDGFIYERFSDDYSAEYSELVVPIDWKVRRDWLLKQPERDLGANFRPQPWIQCAEVLRKMGHERNAMRLEEAREWRRLLARLPARLKGRLTTEFYPFAVILEVMAGFMQGPRWIIVSLFGVFTGFGRAYWRAFLFAAIVITVCAGVFDNAYRQGALIRDPEANFRSSGRADSYATSAASTTAPYPAFDPLIYSLDTFLPIVDLRQAQFWVPGEKESPEETTSRIIEDRFVSGLSPAVYWVWIWTWIEIIAGWIFTTVIIAGFTGLLERKTAQGSLAN